MASPSLPDPSTTRSGIKRLPGSSCSSIAAVAGTALLIAAVLGSTAILFDHRYLGWPLDLLGVDVSAAEQRAILSSHRHSLDALLHGGTLSPVDVAALATALRRTPGFESYAAPSENPPFHVCTVASRPKPGLDLLQETAATFGFSVSVLGVGDAALGLKGWGDGMGRKTLHLLNYLRTVPPGELVMLVDAYDVVFMGPLDERAVQAYFAGLARGMLREPVDPSLEEGSPGAVAAAAAAAHPGKLDVGALLAAPGRRIPAVLFSAEPLTTERWRSDLERRITAGMRFPGLNSGGYMGTAAALAAFLTSLDWAVEPHEDQMGILRMQALARRNASLPLVVLDHDAEVFLSALFVDAETDLLWSPRAARWCVEGVPGCPVAWHYPGHFKRMSIAVGLLTGRGGTQTTLLVRSALRAGWAAGALAATLAFAAGCALSRRSGGGCCGGEPRGWAAAGVLSGFRMRSSSGGGWRAAGCVPRALWGGSSRYAVVGSSADDGAEEAESQ